MLMSIPEGGESGEEKRKGADTILFVVKGRAKSILNGRVREVGKHDVLFVPAGNVHNVSNAGKDELKLIVIYSPALYPEGAAYKTRGRRDRCRYESVGGSLGTIVRPLVCSLFGCGEWGRKDNAYSIFHSLAIDCTEYAGSFRCRAVSTAY